VTSAFQLKKKSPTRVQPDNSSNKNRASQQRLGLSEEKNRATSAESKGNLPKKFLKKGSRFQYDP
jgi:hypothetical protein